ncbi:MAG TPA: hypothetical protein VGZ50_07170 [Actinomycetota bacterium]|nr:hypothetical protein [Actinomycetota bacterium]
MTDDDRAKRIRTAALTVAVFAASGGAAYALFRFAVKRPVARRITSSPVPPRTLRQRGTRPLQRRCDARWGTG